MSYFSKRFGNVNPFRGHEAIGNANVRDFNIEVEVNEQLMEDQQKRLARLFVDNPETRKAVRKAIRKELDETRKRIMRDIRAEMPNDPRQAYRAVKYSLYRQILGGNVSILNRRKAGRGCRYTPPRKLDLNPHQRGGNRTKRESQTTERLNSYFGADRSFILRFLNSGTPGGRVTRYGNRGIIPTNRIFERPVTQEMETTRENVAKILEELLQTIYDGNKEK